jgi:hypothetical protein
VPLFPLHVPSIDSKEFEMIKKMVSIVASFVISGNPNNDPNNQDFVFEAVTSESPLKCLDFSNDHIEMIDFPEIERMKVWDEILEDANIPVY